MTLLPGVTTSRLSRIPRLFTSVISTTRTRREANSKYRISQWWGHRGLHQDEVLECLTTEEMRQVSPNNVDYQPTMTSTPATLLNHPRSQVEGTSSNDHTEPLSACSLAAFEGDKKANNTYEPSIVHMPAAFEGYDSEDSSLSATLLASSRATSHIISSH